MSAPVIGAVFAMSGLEPSQKLVLLALGDHADHDGNNAWPSVETLAQKTGLSGRQVRRILRQLEDLGCVVRHDDGGGRHRPALYSIVLGWLPNPDRDVRVNDNGNPDMDVPLSNPVNPDTRVLVSTAETRTPVSVLPEEKPGHPRPETRTSEHETRTSATENPDIAMSAEPSLTVQRTVQNRPLAEPARKPARRSDPVWEALEVEFGPVTNDTDRGRRNKATKLLRQTLESHHVRDHQHATAVAQMCAAYGPAMPPGSRRTPTAIAANADMLIAHIRGHNQPTTTGPPDRATDQIAELEQLRRQLEADEHQHPPAGAAL